MGELLNLACCRQTKYSSQLMILAILISNVMLDPRLLSLQLPLEPIHKLCRV